MSANMSHPMFAAAICVISSVRRVNIDLGVRGGTATDLACHTLRTEQTIISLCIYI